jgi:hypothetical protein
LQFTWIKKGAKKMIKLIFDITIAALCVVALWAACWILFAVENNLLGY